MLRILHLEDNSVDAAGIADVLRANFRCQLQHVGNKTEFEHALCVGQFDIVLSTFALPSFSGSEALQLARKCIPDIPFLFVSPPIGEPAAVECIKKGATDFLLKHTLERLVPAIRRALEEAAQRNAHAAAVKAQKEVFLRNGVAHEINNVLLPIVMAAEMLQADSAASDRADWIEIILSSAQRGVAIMQRVADASKSVGA